MENRAENMEPINAVCESEVPETVQHAITTADILARIDRIIAQGSILQDTVMQIRHLPVNECPDGGMDGAARANAIEHLCVARETTNQKLIDLLNRMYDDIAPKQASVKVMETLVKMDFAGVLPETSKVMMDFMKNSLM